LGGPFKLVLEGIVVLSHPQTSLGVPPGCSVNGKAWQVSVTVERYKTRGIEIIKVPQSGHSQI